MYVSLLAGEEIADKILNVLDIAQLSKRLRVYQEIQFDTEVKKLAAKAKVNKSLELQMCSSSSNVRFGKY